MARLDEVPRPEVTAELESRPGGIPLYVWVIAAVVLAIPAGLAWGEGATRLNLLPSLIIRALGAWPRPWSCWRSSARSSLTTSGGGKAA